MTTYDDHMGSSPTERFEALAKRLLSVPKAKVDEAEKKRPKRTRRKETDEPGGDPNAAR